MVRPDLLNVLAKEIKISVSLSLSVSNSLCPIAVPEILETHSLSLSWYRLMTQNEVDQGPIVVQWSRYHLVMKVQLSQKNLHAVAMY